MQVSWRDEPIDLRAIRATSGPEPRVRPTGPWQSNACMWIGVSITAMIGHDVLGGGSLEACG
jgi:hypothetical protein